MDYKAFIFDFDYTLGDTTDGIVLSANYALQKAGHEPLDKETIRKTIGMSLEDTYVHLTGDRSEAHKKQFVHLFREKADYIMTDHSIVYPEAAGILPILKKNGYRLAIVTTKYRYRIEEIFKKYGLVDLVDIIVGSNDVSKPKPDPEGLLKAADKLGCPKTDILYIGDNIIDAETAQRAGIDFCAVLTGTNGRKDFETYPYLYIEENLSDLFSILNIDKLNTVR